MPSLAGLTGCAGYNLGGNAKLFREEKASPDRAEIFVNGAKVGDAPLLDPIFVEPGKVKVRVRLEGYASWEKEMDLAAGHEVPLDVALKASAPAPTASATATGRPPPAPRSLVPAYVGGSAGAIMMIAGGALLGSGFAQRGDVETRMPRDANGKPLCVRSADAGPELHSTCSELRNQAAAAQTMANVGLPMLVAGGVVLAGAAAYFFWPNAKGDGLKPAMRVLPVAGASEAGLVFTGTF